MFVNSNGYILVSSDRKGKPMTETFKLYRLMAGLNTPEAKRIDSVDGGYGVLILPEPLPKHVVEAAWSYAVRYTAKGVDVPDLEAAARLMLERHPTWRVEAGFPMGKVAYNPNRAEDDTPDAQ